MSWPNERFSSGADPDTYVPRLALESALAELTEVTDKTPSCAALSGGSGLGKTLLLQVLRRRLQGAYECLYLPSPRLDAAEIWRWAAQSLGLGTGDDDRGAVLGRAGRLPGEGSGLVVLVDDAGLLPPATRADLLAALETRGFTLVLAFDASDRAQLESLPAYVHRIELGPPMTLSETRSYLHARLRQIDPEGTIGARLHAERLASFHEAAGGVPARLNALLDAWLADSGWLSNQPEGRSELARAEPDAFQAPARAEPDAFQAPARAEPDAFQAPARAEPDAFEAPAPQRRAQLPEELGPWGERLRDSRVQLALTALFIAAILGSWLFAWRLSPGVSSVGVPLEDLEPTPAATAEPLPPVAAPARALPPVEAEAEPPPLEGQPAGAAEGSSATTTEPAPAGSAAEADAAASSRAAAPGTSSREVAKPTARVASRRPARSLAPPVPAVPPVRDEDLVEAPVEVVSPPFPEEHVPPPLREQPLAAPPAGPRLSVNARPWASIRLDGTEVGETPIGELRLTPGPHVVTATLPDGRVIERRVEAKAGDLYLVFP